ncbi:uncharacterized protein FIESC28_05108 [Fusarium coffeatum]|uniref:Pantothenate transporter liz1 n=1 Tax=Fusarium coffeatum TaxID=231269 RepID=A0A366RWX6_9HYPO|nr:uncharacterized protein FIESC28_05108 [Fusarium coffeatum]RBR20956.1 hypothetical protein FIESC28_05108 [Fusarium coffeatum]
MSPIVVRSAARTVQRRQFSLLTAMRNAGRAMESHPFGRLPISQKSASPDYAKMFKRVGSQALFFFPGFAVILGWPLAAQYAFDGRL